MGEWNVVSLLRVLIKTLRFGETGEDWGQWQRGKGKGEGGQTCQAVVFGPSCATN